MADRTARPRELRRASTDAERKLWSVLRNRQLGGLKFRRQVPIDGYVADFACREAGLVVELDGGQHAEQREYDAERTRALEACGFHVIRFWNNDVLQNIEGVADAIRAEVNVSRCQALTLPRPSGAGPSLSRARERC